MTRPSSSFADQCVAQHEVNGITWSLWITDRLAEAGAEAGAELEGHWPSNLAIFATMTGREELKNYALRIEKVPDKGLTTGDLDDLTVHDRLSSAFSVRCEIVRREIFREEEKLFFPIQSPADWIDEAGNLAFFFKVRPLDYRQKCLDQEVYFRSPPPLPRLPPQLG